jgi:hypothetical protein
VFQYFLYHFWFFKTAVRRFDDYLHSTATLLTFLYLYADGRPVNTRFNRCAQYMPYRFDPGLLPTGLRSAGLRSAGLRSAGLRSAGLRSAGLRSAGLRPASTCTGFSGTICLRSLLFGENTP